MITAGTGDLLASDAEALVNTVNCVGVMGKGIALQFQKAWPDMFKAYKAACARGEVVPGKMHVWETGRLTGPRVIVNFPTKRHWKQKSRLDDIEAGLIDLVRVIQERGLRSVAVPPLGAGNGGLDWATVRPRVVAAVGPLADVEIRLWEPGDAPAPKDRVVNTPPPQMTSARAAILALMGQYRVLDDDLTQLEVQKLAWFLQGAGFDLRLEFAPHHYGPYADGLYHLLQRLEGHFLRGVTDRSPGAVIELVPEAVEAARAWLRDDPVWRESFERVSRVVEGFETPHGMEVLASVHWLAQTNPKVARDPQAAVEAVHAWSRRKRELMRPEHIQIAWGRLHEQGWLASPEPVQ